MKKAFLSSLFKIGFLLSLFGVLTYIGYSQYNMVLKKTKKELSEQMISFNIENLEALSRYFTQTAPSDFVTMLSNDAALHSRYEAVLRLFKTSNIQYLYVIYKDKSGDYYFLLDSETNLQEKAELNQPFEPLSSNWDESCTSKTTTKHLHNKDQNLWVTVSVPIIQQNRCVALIGADISQNLESIINADLILFGELFFWVALLSMVWFSLLYFTLLYFRQKHKEGYLDALTKVHNRKYLYDVVYKKLTEHYEVLLIDIDFFKKVNDTYGHVVGDEVLKAVASRLKNIIRPTDYIIRFGGEEFLIYTTNLSAKESLAFAQRLRESISSVPIKVDDLALHVTISIGVNPYGGRHDSFREAVAEADKALYQAKESGRNRVNMIGID